MCSYTYVISLNVQVKMMHLTFCLSSAGRQLCRCGEAQFIAMICRKLVLAILIHSTIIKVIVI